MMSMELRYKISDWHQLSNAKSNNSRELSITVSDFINSNCLTGTRIQLYHSKYGILFACVVGAQGSMISEFNDNLVVELTPDQILAELSKYGFNIVYEPATCLPGDQLAYLMSLNNLGYDKLRVLGVYTYVGGVRHYQHYVIAFNITQNPAWLDNAYAASDTEFTDALKNGSAVNISALSKTKRWSWSWLDFVADIGDILKDNS